MNEWISREVLYRGKREDSTEWVYGWCCMYPFGRWPLKAAIIPSEKANEGHFEFVEVIPETVGQYTGLMDKNGKKIFEGDIVHLYGDKCDSNLRCVNYNAFVVFRDGGFCGIDGTPDNYSLRRYSFALGELYCEVIGNIHDNPELLEESQNEN